MQHHAVGRESATRRATTNVFPLGGSRWELELAGPLAPGWAGALAAALARRGISVDRGHALAKSQGLWSARFELLSAHDLRKLDVAALLAEDAEGPGRSSLALDACVVAAAAEHGGSLYVSIEARDCTGFLATLLRRFAYFSLFAVELRLDTRDGRADDHFWLRAGGHRRPAPATGPALRRALHGLLRADRSAAS